MTLNPADPVWPAIVRVLLLIGWIAATGLPISRVLFGGRPRLVWPFYAPAIGFLWLLLVANLVSWAVRGPLGSWLGLVLASALAIALACRTRTFWSLRRAPRVGAAAVLAGSVALYLFILGNRTQTLWVDEVWHLPLAGTIANGFFPPVSPYAPDVGPGYHYGLDLIAATVMNVAAAPPWTIYYLLGSFLLVTFALAAAGLVWDLGAPRLIALGAALSALLLDGSLVVGLPQVMSEPAAGDGFGEAIARLGVPESAHALKRVGSMLINWPQFALGLSLMVVMAAALNAGSRRRHVALFAIGAGLLPLVESSLFLIGWIAVVPTAALLLWRAKGRERRVTAALFAGAALLVILAGGGMTDALFGRGGTTGLAQFAPEIEPSAIRPLIAAAGPASVKLGLLLLLAVAAFTAAETRSRALGYLTLAATAALVLVNLVTTGLPKLDARFVELAFLLMVVAGLASIGIWIARLPTYASAALQVVVLVLVLIPTGLPRGVSGTAIAAQGWDLGYPRVHDPGNRVLNPTGFAAELRSNWPAYAWMRQNLPGDARVLTPHAPVLAAATGRPAPTSPPETAAFDELATPAYLDALRFLNRDQLDRLNASHLHVTPGVEADLHADARRALADPAQFRLIQAFEGDAASGHRIYEIAAGAGVPDPDPSSFAALAGIGATAESIWVSGALSKQERERILLTLMDVHLPQGPDIRITRARVDPRYRPWPSDDPERLVIFPASVMPAKFGLDRGDAVWRGYGLEAFDTRDAWSRVWRAAAEAATPPDDVIAACGGRPGEAVQIRVVGPVGGQIVAGGVGLELDGHVHELTVPGVACERIAVAAANAPIPPFVQMRSAVPGTAGRDLTQSAALAYDVGLDGSEAVINLWYANAGGIPFDVGTELRVYRTDPSGTAPADPHGQASVTWWEGPILLAPELQMSALRFDAGRLTIDDEPGVGLRGAPPPGAYQLALTVAGSNSVTGDLDIMRVIPLVEFHVTPNAIHYRPLSGIVAIDP